MKKHFQVVLVVCISVLLASCAKEGPTGPTGPAGPTYTGDIDGHLDLYDQYGSRVLTGLDSAYISLNGAAPIIPNTAGYYIFTGVITGDYKMYVSATNYAATVLDKFQYLTDTLHKDVKLSALPNFSPSGFTIYPSVVAAGDSLVISFTPDTRARNCIVFFNNTPALSSLPGGYLLNYIKAIPANASSIVLQIPKQDITNTGIASGAMVYYAAYGYVVGDVSVYEDQTSGRNVYNAVSATAAIDSAVAP